LALQQAAGSSNRAAAAMTARVGPARLVVGALVLAAMSFATLIVLLEPGAGSSSTGAGSGADVESRALLTPDDDKKEGGSIADGFDINDDKEENKNGKYTRMANHAHHKYRKHMRKHGHHYIVSFVFQTAIVFGFAWLLRRHGPTCLPQESLPDLDPEVGRAVLAYGLLDEKECWSEDMILCTLSCCCPGIQWANNVSNPRIGLLGSFWVALMLASLNSYELNILTHGVCSLVWAVVAVYARQRLRGKYGLESGSLITLGQDIFVWCCCSRCAVAQEARQFEHVRILDVSNTPHGEATQLQVNQEPTSSRRTLLRPSEDGMGRENTASTDVSGL